MVPVPVPVPVLVLVLVRSLICRRSSQEDFSFPNY